MTLPFLGPMSLTNFAHPWFFLFLLVVAALAALYVAVQFAREKRVLRFANMELLESVAPRRPSRWRHLSAILLVASLVLLTIAISGGPFIGLLGTVIGVMITFAGVAAAGDVNINAIAPGISAALAATVAGLGVAIPALFGYNYLVTRNKDTSAQMYVFVDSLVTRMAENHSSRDAH